MIKMKLIEQFPNLLSGDGIFSEMMNSPWELDIRPEEMDIMFFSSYGDRPISPIFNLLDKDRNGIITNVARTQLGIMIENRFLIQWTKRFNVLKLEYDPLESFKMISNGTTVVDTNATTNDTLTKSGDVKYADTVTYGSIVNDTNNLTINNVLNKVDTNAKTGQDTYSETITHDTTDTTNTNGTVTDKLNKTDTTNESTTNETYGFNSTNSVPSSKETTNTTAETNSTDTTTTENESTLKKTGTDKTESTTIYDNTVNITSTTNDDSTEIGSTRSEKTGSDNRTKTDTYNLTDASSKEYTGKDTTKADSTRTGALGVFTNQDVLQKELDLWKYDFFKTVFEDVASVLTLGIYQVDI